MGVVVLIALVLLGAMTLPQRPRLLGGLLVASMFVTRPALDVAGANIRLEVVIGLICAVALVGDLLRRREQGAARSMPLASWVSLSLVAAWLVGVGLASAFNSPEPASSFSVLIWCAVNVLSAVWVAQHSETWQTIVKVGVAVNLLCGGLAIALWSLATFAGVADIGVQIDPAYGGYASYVAALEANILAGLLCLWGLVAVWNPRRLISAPLRYLSIILTPIALFTTHTRAALVAYCVGLILAAVFRPQSRRLIVASALLAIPAVPVLLTSGDVGFSKFLDLFDTTTGTGGLRERVNAGAFNEWLASGQLFPGLGFNSFGQRNYDLTRPELALPGYIGNLPLQIVYDGGLLALALVAVSAALTVYRLVSRRRLGLVLTFAVPYLLFSVATSALWFLETWLFVGLAWGICRERPRPVEKQPIERSITSSDYAGRFTEKRSS
ncbi:hypothetical protein QE418_000179 [Microbacterium testaceum]|uniref:O-antigen ligase family protein n=1 Tax=Microbacterium TaxID=33882 RepID=UPI0027893BF9|nr:MULTISPECIES: O-antigen ligase family protein [Microbacterium]MDQ1110731.1 hypothetical protein [Microbacterium testaceum]MDR6098723.1 hypothetical protein [Microbacterium sp. SORGH_AS_0454]